jgi:hypothetical protein
MAGRRQRVEKLVPKLVKRRPQEVSEPGHPLQPLLPRLQDIPRGASPLRHRPSVASSLGKCPTLVFVFRPLLQPAIMAPEIDPLRFAVVFAP